MTRKQTKLRQKRRQETLKLDFSKPVIIDISNMDLNEPVLLKTKITCSHPELLESAKKLTFSDFFTIKPIYS